MKWLIRIASGLAGLILLLLIASQIWLAVSTRSGDPFEPTQAELKDLEFYSQPESWFLENLQGPREVIDGQTLDPKLQYMFEQARMAPEWTSHLPPLMYKTPWGRAYLRGEVDRHWQLYTLETKPMASVEDRIIPGRGAQIPVRIYTPQTDHTGPLPVLVYHHGGGWIFASIAALDRVSRVIANEAGVIVISVDYRLSPEHHYPAASDDGEDVFLWAVENAASLGGDPARVAAGGDSAGGHVAINIAQRRLAAGAPAPAALLLFYPGAGLPANDPSYQLFGKGYGLDRSFIEFILPRVFPDLRTQSPEEADGFMDPAGKAESFEGMPPVIIATAGFDILRDSGRRFAQRLEEDGVAVTYTNYPSLAHSFLQFSAIVEDARIATQENARRLAVLLHTPPSSAP